MEVHPPFSRYRARFSKRPWRISSARARFIVERERLAGLSSSQVCWCVAHRPDNPNPLLRPFLALFPQAIPHCAGCAYQRECSVPLPQ